MALSGLHHALVMHQPNIVLPFIIHHERRGIDKHFVETVQPLNAEFKHRQTEKQRDAGVFQGIEFKPLQRHQALLL